MTKIYQNDKLTSVIYDTNWYVYDVTSQKMMQMILHDSQHPNCLMIGTFGELNVVTGIAVFVTIFLLQNNNIDTICFRIRFLRASTHSTPLL